MSGTQEAVWDLDSLAGRARALAGARPRAILGITGPPGAGKSTLAGVLVRRLAAEAVLVPMDGFHFAQVELQRLGRAARKGAPDTFDVGGYVALLARLRRQLGETVYAPSFRRDLEEPIAGAIPVPPSAHLVVTEGNYLLERLWSWDAVRPLLDEVWYLDLDEKVRVSRLVARHIAHGRSAPEARRWVQDVDQVNAARIEAARDQADLVVRVAPKPARRSQGREEGERTGPPAPAPPLPDQAEVGSSGARPATSAQLIQALARSKGGFALVALDQRESLRGYLSEVAARPVEDAELRGFKRAALEDLGDLASGVLLDVDYGLPALSALNADGGHALKGGLVVAVDRLVQETGGPITAVDLDDRLGPDDMGRLSCVALKLLVIWRPDKATRAACHRLVGMFLERCQELGVLGLLEGVLDEPGRERARLGSGPGWFEMHRELLDFSPDVYKTELPTSPHSDDELIVDECSGLSAMARCPWVLLSSGIDPDRFPDTLAAACRGGASGFAAGRAIWRAAISPLGYRRLPVGGARERLQSLISIVDSYARPWAEAAVARGGAKPPRTSTPVQ
jgi:tagatose-1,6-bisphosphate aldolase/pantothenate kinase